VDLSDGSGCLKGRKLEVSELETSAAELWHQNIAGNELRVFASDLPSITPVVVL
jgi:hypothetical protein